MHVESDRGELIRSLQPQGCRFDYTSESATELLVAELHSGFIICVIIFSMETER